MAVDVFDVGARYGRKQVVQHIGLPLRQYGRDERRETPDQTDDDGEILSY